jgi:hypothetical protein
LALQSAKEPQPASFVHAKSDPSKVVVEFESGKRKEYHTLDVSKISSLSEFGHGKRKRSAPNPFSDAKENERKKRAMEETRRKAKKDECK